MSKDPDVEGEMTWLLQRASWITNRFRPADGQLNKHFRSVAALAVFGVVVAGCSSTPEKIDPKDVVLVVDSAITAEAPAEVDLADGVKASFYYSVTSAKVGNRPVVHVELVPDPPGPSVNFRAHVEVSQNGEPIDVYFSYDDSGSTKNEKVVTGSSDRVESQSFGLLPQTSGPRYDGSSDELNSRSGDDFTFTLSQMETSTSPFQPTELVRRSLPTFDETPADQFNKLASERRWPVPSSFKSPGIDPVRLPAIAMQSFIDQVNGWGIRGATSSSPTQIFADWMTDWNVDMLTEGIKTLGDAQIKDTYQRVLSGDIEKWFGNGTYVVGNGPNQIPPGTYVSAKPNGALIKDAYWERTSASGDIIDNNFVSSAQQVTVTIASGDGQFTSSGMGTWRPSA
ncbi:hypothetical protein BH92_28185 (plasmid) [Rhodococcoides fascians A21d2]|uniref:hypothetical protein n=1 Tax=Rhodococcoides fascians TaxID=1828 RepID=UPI0012D2C7A9|nr:hypothetical protein [Rhodococcus fascians]QII03942.1 hypothetical protein BH92_28185 [Rhodococcus fascians A21d2]